MKLKDVCLCSDRNGFWRAEIAAWSIKRFLGEDVRIHIITDSYWSPHISGCIVHNPTKALMNVGFFPESWSRHIPFGCLFRLAIPLMEDFKGIDSIVYLDTDILVLSEDAKRAFENIELSDHEIMAAPDLYRSNSRNAEHIDSAEYETKIELNSFWERNNVRERTYVNSGLLIFNLKKIRENLDWYKRRLELFWREELRGRFYLLDQEFVNLMSDLDYSVPEVLNCISTDKAHNCKEEDALCRHYICGCKGMLEKATSLGYTKHAARCRKLSVGGIPESSRQLAIYLCHEVTDESIRRYMKLKTDTAGMNIDTVWVVVSETENNVPEGIDCIYIRGEDLKKNKQYTCLYNKQGIGDVYHSAAAFALMETARKRQGYDYYWLIEYDVYYSGNWSDFFRLASNYSHDLVCENLEPYDESIGWMWWGRALFKQFRYVDSYKALLCVTRASKKMIDRLEHYYCTYNKEGDMFNENMWPTVAVNELSCLDIADICGDGFTYKKLDPRRTDFKKGKLYHAVKLDTDLDKIKPH